jgi:protein-S-isoprenylcysteine O-methyltransferase Ste14
MLSIILSVAGFVPSNATPARVAAMSASLALACYLALGQPHNRRLAILYALGSIFCYVGFLFLVLRGNGLRRWIMKRCGGEENGYLVFQAILGFLFFHNGVAIGYVASSSPGIAWDILPKGLLLSLAAALFVVGWVTKLWAAAAASIDIYYWKDMFLARKVCDFVETGPYRYLSNPMYGVGQLQAYAIAIWYGSLPGLLIALVNQCSVFLFYFVLEKPFIRRVYVKQTPRAPRARPRALRTGSRARFPARRT